MTAWPQRSGQTGLVLESEIEPLSRILSLENDVIPSAGVDPELLNVCTTPRLYSFLWLFVPSLTFFLA